MTYNAAKPRYTLKLAGKEYVLEGSFGLIEAVEYALGDDVISIAESALEMPVYKVAKLTSAMLKHCGFDVKQSDVAEIIVNEIGIASNEFAILRFHLFAFLKICICKPSEREQVSIAMGEMIGKLTAPTASLGDTTSSSV